MTSVIAKLKDEVADWEREVTFARYNYLQQKKVLKEVEKELASAKRNFNKCYKLWTDARKMLQRKKSKLSAYPSTNRRYTKEHIGEVFKKMEEGKLK